MRVLHVDKEGPSNLDDVDLLREAMQDGHAIAEPLAAVPATVPANAGASGDNDDMVALHTSSAAEQTTAISVDAAPAAATPTKPSPGGGDGASTPTAPTDPAKMTMVEYLGNLRKQASNPDVGAVVLTNGVALAGARGTLCFDRLPVFLGAFRGNIHGDFVGGTGCRANVGQIVFTAPLPPHPLCMGLVQASGCDGAEVREGACGAPRLSFHMLPCERAALLLTGGCALWLCPQTFTIGGATRRAGSNSRHGKFGRRSIRR